MSMSNNMEGSQYREHMQKVKWTLLFLSVATGIALIHAWNQKAIVSRKEANGILRIKKATLREDTASVANTAIFLCTQQGEIYNDCECTQNVPLLGGSSGLDPVEPQEIYPGQTALVYSYSPYKRDMRVDSVHWSVDDFEPLLVGIPQLVTSHVPECQLEFVPLMGRVHVLENGKPCNDVTLYSTIPLEGSVNLLTESIEVERETETLHMDGADHLLLAKHYRNMRIHLGGKDYSICLDIVAGKCTWVDCRSDTHEVITEIKNDKQQHLWTKPCSKSSSWVARPCSALPSSWSAL